VVKALTFRGYFFFCVYAAERAAFFIYNKKYLCFAAQVFLLFGVVYSS